MYINLNTASLTVKDVFYISTKIRFNFNVQIKGLIIGETNLISLTKYLPSKLIINDEPKYTNENKTMEKLLLFFKYLMNFLMKKKASDILLQFLFNI